MDGKVSGKVLDSGEEEGKVDVSMRSDKEGTYTEEMKELAGLEGKGGSVVNHSTTVVNGKGSDDQDEDSEEVSEE